MKKKDEWDRAIIAARRMLADACDVAYFSGKKYESSIISKFFPNRKHYIALDVVTPEFVTITIRQVSPDIAAQIIELIKDGRSA